MEKETQEKKHRRWEWIPFLLAMLLSFFCVFTATAMALMSQPDKLDDASMLPVGTANYGELDSDKLRFAQIDEAIFADATQDSAGLRLTPDSSGESAGNRKTPIYIAFVTPAPSQTPFPSPMVVTMDAPGTAVPTYNASALPSITPIPTSTKQPTITPMATATSTRLTTLTVTPTPWSLPTNTTTPWPTVTWTHTPVSPPPPTNTPRPPSPSTNTPRPPTSTATSVLATATSTTTSTGTATATATGTATATATGTSTATATAIPCSGSGVPNIGPPDNSIAIVACGQSITINLGGTPLDLTPPDGAYDLVYYEMQNPTGFISVDWVIIEISDDGTNWVEVFNWGDGNPANNGNISGTPGEPDNHILPISSLYNGNTTGIAIDADAFVSPGTYQYIRITSPLGGDNDGSEVDSIELLP